MSAGEHYTCGVGVDGSVSCWGNAGRHPGSPGGEFTSVDVGVSGGRDFACGVSGHGSVVCWGPDAWDSLGGVTSPRGVFRSVSAGYWQTCGVRDNRSVICWGYDLNGESSPPEGRFVALSAGEHFTCGVKEEGSLVCWGGSRRPSPIASRQVVERPELGSWENQGGSPVRGEREQQDAGADRARAGATVGGGSRLRQARLRQGGARPGVTSLVARNVE